MTDQFVVNSSENGRSDIKHVYNFHVEFEDHERKIRKTDNHSWREII